MTTPIFRPARIAAAVAALFALGASQAHGAGFALQENSGSGLGNAFAGGVLAARRARGRVATVAVNSFTFKQPVLVGDLVTFYAEVVRVGRTSVTVDVEVYAQRNPTDIVTVKVTEASLTYVAVGGDRKPRPIPAE